MSHLIQTYLNTTEKHTHTPQKSFAYLNITLQLT